MKLKASTNTEDPNESVDDNIIIIHHGPNDVRISISSVGPKSYYRRFLTDLHSQFPKRKT